ncbi:MAG: hypothetical protein R3D57_02820 [Hyphomicrobiaceae bacterium]
MTTDASARTGSQASLQRPARGILPKFAGAHSALDAARFGFSVSVVTDTCRAINLDGSLTDATV